MRLIFFTLLGVNVLIAIWGLFIAGQDDVDPSLSTGASYESQVASITPENLVGLGDQQQAQSDSVTNEARLCDLVGPFGHDDDASVFAERLRSVDIPSKVQNIELKSGESYWVHLSPEETSAAAYKKLSEVQALGIESYVIGKGELENSVSLGVFTNKRLAETRLKELQAQGLEVEISTRPRTEVEVWVVIQPEDAEKISSITWENLLEGMSSQERRQNFCFPVAS